MSPLPHRTRLATVEDWPLVDAFHRQCSPENLYRRWGRTVVRQRDWHQLCAVTTTWVTTPPDTGTVIALTALGPVPHEPGAVDLGLQVADAWQRHGLGTALTQRASHHAHTAGAHTLAAYVQAANTPMLTVLRRLGPTREKREGTHLEIRLPLTAPSSHALSAAAEPATPS